MREIQIFVNGKWDYARAGSGGVDSKSEAQDLSKLTPDDF